MKLLLARWIATITGPLIRNGAVAFDENRIHMAGSAAELIGQYPHAERHDAGASIVFPGLVNAHTHLELTACPRPQNGEAAASFASWLRHVLLQRARLQPHELSDEVERSIRAGIAQCLRFGVTTVGDISRQCQLTRPLLARSPLRVVSYGEVQAMAQRRDMLEERLTTALDASSATDRLTIGLTPHAPYTVEPHAYAQCLAVAKENGLPLATHLAETLEEHQFLAGHSGPLRELWDWLGWWDDQVPHFEGGPIRLAQSLGLLDYPTLLAHVNYCDDDELSLLAAGRASIVYNPRTHAYFGHPPHRWQEMLLRGINVAVGTDSCASSPDLNIVDELRLLRQLSPNIPAQTLWEMATVRGARALGLNHAGAIAPSMFPDFTIFNADTEQPLEELLHRPVLPEETWIGGICAGRSESRL